MKEVSVVIVSFNTSQQTVEAVRTVLNQNLDLEIIVVDNNSSDNSTSRLNETFPSIKLIRNNTNVGFAKAVNQGIEASSGNYIFLMNPDSIIEQGSLEKLREYLTSHNDVGVVGPKILNMDGTLQRSAQPFPTLKYAVYEFLQLSRLFPKSKEFGGLRMTWWDFNQEKEVDRLTGAALLIRKDVFKRYGLLDERYFLYYEETDLMLRISKDGQYKVIFYPEAIVRHHLNKSLGSTNFKTVNYSLTSMNKYYLKNYGAVYNLLVNMFTFLGSITNTLLILVLYLFKKDLKSPLLWYIQVLRWYLSFRFIL